MRRLIFLRDFRQFSGGHLKVWHYFRHALASRRFQPVVCFTSDSRIDHSNPWESEGARLAREWNPTPDDVVFLGGTDWQWIDAQAGRRPDPRTPIINIIQGMGHADPADPRYAFLTRRAVRLCVNPMIETALRGAPVNGPMRTIPIGMDTTGAGVDALREGWVIAAMKQPELGRALARRLRHDGLDVRLLDSALPRADYLSIIARAAAVVCLPLPVEGFYLPALEAMALGANVVCPDCVGNRFYLEHGVNGLMPAYTPDAIAMAVHALSSMFDAQRRAMRERGCETAAELTLERERDAFLALLDDVDALWESAS